MIQAQFYRYLPAFRACTLLLAAFGLLVAEVAPAAAAGADGAISGFTWNPATGQAVVSVPKALQYRVFTLAHPDRVVVDFLNARAAQGVRFSAGNDPLIRDVRAAPRFDGKGERLVFDLAHAVNPRSFLRHSAHGEELVIALGADKQVATPVITAANSRPQRLRDVVVVIDAGHGGHDSGAIGPGHLMEKTVTLAVAKDLYRLLSKVKGIKPVLTRNSDYFVSLGGRRKIARAAHADLFVSIHADSSPYHYPKGSTVYVLSEHGASSVAARILAQRENAVDEIGGVKLDDEEPVVRTTIVKLSQRGSIAQGMLLASDVMSKINAVVPLHSDDVERAAFAVLKSPDIPSILVETAFISNRKEEHQLASSRFREHIAGAISKGVEKYVRLYAPPGTLIAARRNAIYALQKG
ncbi:MAG: N-acetylmuramoyl-L-alanine amidase [Gammaproteobacteria bacterium]